MALLWEREYYRIALRERHAGGDGPDPALVVIFTPVLFGPPPVVAERALPVLARRHSRGPCLKRFEGGPRWGWPTACAGGDGTADWNPGGTHPLRCGRHQTSALPPIYRLMGENGHPPWRSASAVVNQVVMRRACSFRSSRGRSRRRAPFRACPTYLRAMRSGPSGPRTRDWQPIPGARRREP